MTGLTVVDAMAPIGLGELVERAGLLTRLDRKFLLPVGDLPAVLAALRATGYDRLVSLELSRDGHRAHQMVPRSIELLRKAEG